MENTNNKDARQLKWELNLREFNKYKQLFGDCYVAYDYETDSGIMLGAWLKRQAKLMEMGELPAERIALLNEVDEKWCQYSSSGKEWVKGVSLLSSYIKQFNTHLIPLTYKSHCGFELGQWFFNTSVRCMDGKLEKCKSEVLERLGALGLCRNNMSPLLSGDIKSGGRAHSRHEFDLEDWFVERDPSEGVGY